MAYSQSKKQSETEKKLQALRTQLYGKPESQRENQGDKSPLPKTSTSTSTFSFSSPLNNSAHAKLNDDSSLKHDLVKTMVFASLAIGVQLLLYFSLNKFRF